MTEIHAALERSAEAHLALIEVIAAIPAPSFGEGDRAAYLVERFREAGLRDVEIDGAQNVRGGYADAAAPVRVMLAAHMDTVHSPTEWLDTTSLLPGLHVLADAVSRAAEIAAEAARRR